MSERAQRETDMSTLPEMASRLLAGRTMRVRYMCTTDRAIGVSILHHAIGAVGTHCPTLCARASHMRRRVRLR